MDLEWIEEIKEQAAKTNAPVDGLIQALVYEDEAGRSELKAEIESILDSFIPSLVLSKNPVLPICPKEKSVGDVKIGRVMHGDKALQSFAITKEELNQHLLCVARSGAGKTVLLINIIAELLRLGIPFIAFDFKKDYRHLIRQYPQILVIRWEDLRFNPLQPPPSVSLQRWKQIFVDCFSHCFGFFHGSRNFLLEFLDRLYRERGSNATVQELYELVASCDEPSRRRSEYSDVVENRLYSISSNLDKVVNCKGYPIEKLLEQPVVIELDGLGRDEQNFLVESLLFWIYAYRLAQGHRSVLRHSIICDEGKRIFDATKEYRESTTELGVAPIDIVTDEIREFGEALIVADQEPSKLTHSIKANTYTKITGFLGHGGDINDIAEAMDLDDEARKAITKLERGMWLVKLAGRYTKPFLIQSEDFPLAKDVTDEEIKQKMKPILLELGLEEEVAVADIDKPRVILPEVSEDAWTLLLDIAAHPFRSIAARYKAVAFSARRGDEAKNELLKKELIREVSIHLGNQRPSKFLVLTNLALNLLKNVGHDVGLWVHVGRMGFEHQLYLVLIGYSFKNQGYQVAIEKTLGDRRVDLYIDKGKKIAIEIELGAYYLNEEVKVLQHVDELIILTKESRIEIEQKLQQLSPEVKQKVRIQNVIDYLRSNDVAFSNGIKPNGRNKATSSNNLGNKQK
jgi:hypothetical protein